MCGVQMCAAHSKLLASLSIYRNESSRLTINNIHNKFGLMSIRSSRCGHHNDPINILSKGLNKMGDMLQTLFLNAFVKEMILNYISVTLPFTAAFDDKSISTQVMS